MDGMRKKTISKYVQRQLREKKIHKSELADCLGLQRQAMTYKFKYNKWSLDDLSATAKFLGMSLKKFIAQSGQE